MSIWTRARRINRGFTYTTTYPLSVFSGGFSKSALSLSTNFPSKEVPYADDYDYSKDSDSEDANKDIELVSDSAALSGMQPSGGSLKGKEKKTKTPSGDAQVNTHRVVVIRNGAANIWRAIAYYLYTGDIEFAPLRSGGMDLWIKQMTTWSERHPDRPQLCFPKSIYRLADKLGIPALKTLALKKIEGALTTKNIFMELFSQFLSRYPEVLKRQTIYLQSMGVTKDMKAVMRTTIASVVDEKVPHVVDAIMSLVVTPPSMGYSAHLEEEEEDYPTQSNKRARGHFG